MRRVLVACAASVALIGLASCEDLAGPGEPVDLSYAPCVGASDNPSWFAVQDGDGAWQRVNASSSGSFDFTISSGRAGVAMVANGSLFVVFATTDELKANFPACAGAAVRTLSGSVTGYTTADNVRIAMGTSKYDVFGTQQPPAAFALSTVDATASDLIAVRHRTSATNSPYQVIPNNVLLRRNVTGSSTSTVDFSTAEGGAPLNPTLTLTNLVAGEELTVLSNVALKSTMGNIAVYEAAASFSSGQATAPFYGVPANRLTTGESQMVLIGASRTVSSSTRDNRFMSAVFTDPVNRSMTLGPALGTVTVTGTSRPSATYTVQAAYDNLYDVVFSQGIGGSNERIVEVLATNAYLDGATSVTLTVPNLVGVSGFSSNWLLQTGVSSSWSFLATDADLALLTNRPITYQGADRTSTFTP